MSGKHLRDVPVCLWVSPEELEAIQGRMAEAGIRNMSAYLRKMALQRDYAELWGPLSDLLKKLS